VAVEPGVPALVSGAQRQRHADARASVQFANIVGRASVGFLSSSAKILGHAGTRSSRRAASAAMASRDGPALGDVVRSLVLTALPELPFLERLVPPQQVDRLGRCGRLMCDT